MTDLDRAIRQLRSVGLTIRLSEGEGKAALWDIGPLKRVGYYEVIRLAEKTIMPFERDASMVPLHPWPDLPKDAFR